MILSKLFLFLIFNQSKYLVEADNLIVCFSFCKGFKRTYPIVQAAMHWITDANLVGAVSNAGGMGVLGPNAGAKSTSSRSTCL
ncbi:MAG: nitronate monooxygenase [Bacillota bacterium]